MADLPIDPKQLSAIVVRFDMEDSYLIARVYAENHEPVELARIHAVMFDNGGTLDTLQLYKRLVIEGMQHALKQIMRENGDPRGTLLIEAQPHVIDPEKEN